MIPGSFAYHAPTSAAEAARLLAQFGDDARPLAGGHSLVPMMKLRLAAPSHLVDLRRCEDLRGIARDGGFIVIGAMTTQHDLIASDILGSAVPIIRETSLLIADPQVRYVGTIGGNLANGDPGNDMPAVMMALGARYRLMGAAGSRKVEARDYYQGAYFTAAEPGEIVTAVEISVPPAGHGFAYEKLKRKVGDYATAAAAVVLTRKGDVVETSAIALTNVAETPLLAEEAAEILTGSNGDDATIARAVAAAEAITAPASDGRGPAEYRTKMAGVMLARAIRRAYSRAA